ncbi:MAG TPA: hypothetical protein VK016_03100 [Arenimonas sp.]|jgi:fimbrial chaperone protein|nr:hypothetical protein [Arenimonas sp.]
MLRLLLATACLLAPSLAAAQGFSAYVLPPRFEDAAKAGTVYRNVVEIQNMSPEAVRFGVRTADWDLDEQGEVAFDYALAADSCRPWVGLEAREIRLDPNGRKRFRFEVAVPEGTPARQCRFAIMIEGEPEKTDNGMAVAGRIGVIVYLDIGGASARLQVVRAKVATVRGQGIPVLTVVNDGNAHGRLEGFLDSRDASGRRWTLAPSNDPILPGRQREIALFPVGEAEGSEVPPIAFPIRLEGKLDWRGQRVPVDMVVGQ